jgi:hypothetical protein
MQGRIFQGLDPVRRRQKSLLILRAAVLGLLASSVAGIGLGLWRWLTGGSVSPQTALLILAAGPVLGALVGLVWKHGWHGAALAVDDHYHLKDRSATALDFVRRASSSALHQLQVSDAEEHLTGITPQEVVPFRMPRALPFAGGALIVAVALLALPLTSKKVAAGPTAPLPAIVAEAEAISEDLKQLDELAKSEQNKELHELVEKLREKVEEMKEPGVDVREALAKLSEMQAAIQAQQAQYNVGLVDAQMASLGEAMTSAESLEAAGKALMDAKFEKAAEQLEKMEMPDVDRKEARAVEEKLKQVAQEMGDVGLGQLGAATSDMAEGLKSGHKGRFQQGTKQLAQLAKSQGSRRKIKEILDAELDELEEGKGNVDDSDKTFRFRMPKKSDSPSQDWGAEISGNVFGNKTNMKTNHDVKEITGTPGDGPSEMETTHSPEGRQVAGRSYKEAYQKYRKMSEAVLDSEPIPLGHRQTIRKYFELIRPQNLDADPSDTAKKERDSK